MLMEAILQLNGGNLGLVSLLRVYWLDVLLGSPEFYGDKVLSYESITYFTFRFTLFWRSWRCIGFAISALIYIAVCFYTAYSVSCQRAALLMQAALTISKRHCLGFLVCLSGLELRQKCYVYLIPLEKIPLLHFEECMKRHQRVHVKGDFSSKFIFFFRLVWFKMTYKQPLVFCPECFWLH